MRRWARERKRATHFKEAACCSLVRSFKGKHGERGRTTTLRRLLIGVAFDSLLVMMTFSILDTVATVKFQGREKGLKPFAPNCHHWEGCALDLGAGFDIFCLTERKVIMATTTGA